MHLMNGGTAQHSKGAHKRRALETSWKEDLQRTDVKHGAFSDQEVARLRKGVAEYAHEHQLSTSSYE